MVKLNCKGDFDIVFPDAGNFTLDSVSVKAIDITDYDERYETLSQDTLQNAEIGINQVKGTLSAGQEALMHESTRLPILACRSAELEMELCNGPRSYRCINQISNMLRRSLQIYTRI